MYINNVTQQYPVSEQDIRNQYPNTSFTIPFQAPEEYSWVFPAPQPSYNAITHIVTEDLPEFTSKGCWEQRWKLVEQSPESISVNETNKYNRLSANIREERNKKLLETDWTQLPDAPVDSALWASYRQQLRDVTSQTGFPLEVVWPQPPV